MGILSLIRNNNSLKGKARYIRNCRFWKSYRVQKLISSLGRWYVMNGLPIPWLLDENISGSCYWESRTLSTNHSPMQYLVPNSRTEVLFADLLPYLDNKTSLIEVGCNAGVNLKYLFDRGYRNLAGLEINRYAVENVLQKEYPALYEKCTFFIGNAYKEIRKIPDASFDVVFSNGVLMHISPAERSLFRDMVRISKKYIVVITGEIGSPFPYDFEKIFSDLGCKTILYRSFYGENFPLPLDLYDPPKHCFQESFLRIFIKKR